MDRSGFEAVDMNYDSNIDDHEATHNLDMTANAINEQAMKEKKRKNIEVIKKFLDEPVQK